MKTNLTELKRATTFENFNLCSLSSQTLWIVRYIPEILYRQGCEIDNISHPRRVWKRLYFTPPLLYFKPIPFQILDFNYSTEPNSQWSEPYNGISLYFSPIVYISLFNSVNVKLSSDKLRNLVDYCLLMTDYCYSYWLLAIYFL